MGRQAGVQNRDTGERRRALLDRMRVRLGALGATRASWRELAGAAGVGLATLNHHFGKRDDVIRAILLANGEEGREPLAVLGTPSGPFGRSVRDALAHLARGLQHHGVGEMVTLGLVEGLRQPTLGPVFVGASLEPIIQAAAARLAAHQADGEMRPCDPRLAAIALISPVVVAYLHQTELGGADTHPLSFDDLIEAHASAFVRGYGFGRSES